jgi:hypothetical protein
MLMDIFDLTDHLPALHVGSFPATLTGAETTPDIVLNYVARIGISTKEDTPVSGQKLNKRKEQP